MEKIFTTGILALAMLIPTTTYAQVDEIVVTAKKRQSDGPGLFLEKRGDFLLLEVSIENDSRELSTRTEEIGVAVSDFIAAAKKNPEITLSIIDESNFVRPLSQENFNDGIRSGNRPIPGNVNPMIINNGIRVGSIATASRPDTSITYLKVKTEIPDKVEDSYKLANKLAVFVESIEEKGRTTISTYDEISVSVVNPYQYRTEVMKLVTDEVNTVTQALGPEYRVIMSGLDKELKWARSGDLNLAF